jgi:DNA-binding IclR family transcriptional regulator
MGDKLAEHDEINQRILFCMQRAPGGNTAVQLARNTGLSLPEVQRSLTELHRAGAILRAARLPYPAFHLVGQELASVGRVTAREAADRQRSRPIG